MRNARNKFITLFSLTLIMMTCSYAAQRNIFSLYEKRSSETEKLLSFLKEVPQKGYMIGHHDDTIYGIGWENEEGRSDIKSVCGDYPAVISFDLGHVEHGASKSLDNVLFSKIRKEIVNQYERGGIISLSWHLDNPLTGKDSWDVSDSTVVASILPEGSQHEKFLIWMDRLTSFINSLKTDNGKKIPVIFRPWHEHTGSWFWWGQNLCTVQQYKELWRMTASILKEKGVDNVLLAYSPGGGYESDKEYFDRYPGDDIIDLLGVDIYQFKEADYKNQLDKSLDILQNAGRSHDKPIALTETGYETIPDSTWFTKVLMPIANKYPISYLLLWRNAREKDNHFYGPYPGHKSANDFVEFYNDDKTLFLKDVKGEIYK